MQGFNLRPGGRRVIPSREATETTHVDDSFYAQRDALRRRTQDGPVDFNELSPTGKQAALSLQQESLVKFAERGGRMLVESARPNLFLQAISAGLVS